MIPVRACFLLVLFCCLCVSFVRAEDTTSIPRKIIAFYNPKPNQDLYHNPIHQHLELVLNYLGMSVVYHKVNDPLPGEDEMRGVRAVVTWFNGDRAVADPETYCKWLTRQMEKGVRWVAMHKLGMLAKNGPGLSPSCRNTFATLGAAYKGENTIDELFLEVVAKDPGMVEFERELSFTEDLRYVLVRLRDKRARSYLKLKRTDLDNSTSDLVFTTPRGGYVHAGFVYFENKVLNKIKWRLNPFRFFEEALGLQGLPRPDVTTVNGRRTFMSHIDGDGIFNESHIDRASYSGEIIYERILKKHPDLPHSVSLITGYFDIATYQSLRAHKLYADIFSLPNVEAAAHGYAHPLVWKKGTVAIDVPGYDFDAKFEIQGAVIKMRELFKTLGIAKPVDTFFWTGDCLPSAKQISYATDFGLSNINGGESRYDSAYDSYAFLFPLGLNREGAQQVYASFPNENVFTNLWKGPYYGFRDIVESFRNTDAPKRLKALDIYYHFYSGERMASLRALESAFAYVLKQEIFPVTASEYARMVGAFYDAELYQIPDGFRVYDDGWLKTVRFDSTLGDIDFSRSSGVIGSRKINDGLYIFLDDSGRHDIYFAKPRMGMRPHFISATFAVKDLRTGTDGMSFFKNGWYKNEAIIGGLSPNASYKIREGARSFLVRADRSGTANVVFATFEKGDFPATGAASGPWFHKARRMVEMNRSRGADAGDFTRVEMTIENL